jgi:hypothetical protein
VIVGANYPADPQGAIADIDADGVQIYLSDKPNKISPDGFLSSARLKKLIVLNRSIRLIAEVMRLVMMNWGWNAEFIG